MRIVCLVPSLTELLFDLGLAKNVVGRTRFCIHPADRVEDVAIVGGTKNPNIDRIKQLSPDLIIMNKEENRKEDALLLEQVADLLVTDINTIEDALISITEIAQRTGTNEAGKQLTNAINRELKKAETFEPVTAAYLIWKKPYMTVGGDTYIHHVMDKWGLKNVFADDQRYPEITTDDLRRIAPQLILLSSEPYPFSAKHVSELEKEVPGSKPMLVNGEFFSWYGSRMLPAFRYLNRWRAELGSVL